MPEELLDSEGALKEPGDECEPERRAGKEGGAGAGQGAGGRALSPGRRALSDNQRDELEERLRSLLPDR